MSDSESESHGSGSAAADTEDALQPETTTWRSRCEPRTLFQRPRRKGLLRPAGMTVTGYNGRSHYVYANRANDPRQYRHLWGPKQHPDDDDSEVGDMDSDKDLSQEKRETRGGREGGGPVDDAGGDEEEERDPDLEGEEEEEDLDPNGLYIKRVVVRTQGQLPEAQEDQIQNNEDVTEEAEQQDDSVTSDSEFYDTDLEPETTVTDMFQSLRPPESWSAGEDEVEEEEEGKEPGPDLVRRADYLRVCHQQNATLQTAILRQLDSFDLDLRYRNVGTLNLKPLFSALRNNMKVRRLLLDENGLDAEGMECLSTELLDNVTLSYLSLSNNPLGRKGLAPLVRLLMSNKIIEGLDLSSSKLGGDCVPLLSHLLKENTTLKFLDLSRNTLEEDLIRLLAAAIGENYGLHFLRLSGNNLRQTGAAAIGQSLTVNECLRVLDLSWNGLGYQGAVAIAKSLKDNECLRELDVSHSNITWRGALVLSSALAKNSTLRILRAGGNPITTTGAHDLVEGASSVSSQLRLLDISGVCVTFDTEVMATSIQQFRPFSMNHGGVVSMSDSIGRRLDRQRMPIERLLVHLKERMIRPLELLRQFDKQSTGRVTLQEFVARMRKENVPLHNYEIRALAASVSEMELEEEGRAINYKKLIESVEQHIWQERMRKIKERVVARRLQQYHQRILQDGTPFFSTFSWASSFHTEHLSHGLLSSSSGGPDSLLLTSSAPLLKAGRESALTLLSSRTEMPALAPLKKSRHKFTLSQPLQEIGVKATKKKSKVKKKKRRRTKQQSQDPPTLVSALNNASTQ